MHYYYVKTADMPIIHSTLHISSCLILNALLKIINRLLSTLPKQGIILEECPSCSHAAFQGLATLSRAFSNLQLTKFIFKVKYVKHHFVKPLHLNFIGSNYFIISSTCGQSQLCFLKCFSNQSMHPMNVLKLCRGVGDYPRVI